MKLSRIGWEADIHKSVAIVSRMSVWLLLPILAFFGAPFAISGFRRSWRGVGLILIVLALYTAYVWLRPAPTLVAETDRIGGAAWTMIVMSFFLITSMSFFGGVALSFVHHRK